MSDDFAALHEALDGMADRLATSARLRLGRAIATDLRAANARRIKANVTPEGAKMVPRKAQEGKAARMQAMFRRASAPRFLRREASTSEARVGFAGAMARIMRVHQHGLRDRVARTPGASEVSYPARPVVGMTAEDRLRVLNKVEAAIAG